MVLSPTLGYKILTSQGVGLDDSHSLSTTILCLYAMLIKGLTLFFLSKKSKHMKSILLCLLLLKSLFHLTVLKVNILPSYFQTTFHNRMFVAWFRQSRGLEMRYGKTHAPKASIPTFSFIHARRKVEVLL